MSHLDGRDKRLKQLWLAELAQEPQGTAAYVLVRVIQIISEGVADLNSRRYSQGEQAYNHSLINIMSVLSF